MNSLNWHRSFDVPYGNYLTRVDARQHASTRSVWMLTIFNISLIWRVEARRRASTRVDARWRAPCERGFIHIMYNTGEIGDCLAFLETNSRYETKISTPTFYTHANAPRFSLFWLLIPSTSLAPALAFPWLTASFHRAPVGLHALTLSPCHNRQKETKDCGTVWEHFHYNVQ